MSVVSYKYSARLLLRPGTASRLWCLACVVLATQVAHSQGNAEESPAPAFVSNTQLRISADKVSTDVYSQSINYRGNIRLEHRSVNLNADSLDYNHGDGGRLSIVGQPVTVVVSFDDRVDSLTIQALRVQMIHPYNQVEFSGSVRVSDGNNQIDAEKILLDLDKQIYSGEGIQIVIPDLDKLPGGNRGSDKSP